MGSMYMCLYACVACVNTHKSFHALCALTPRKQNQKMGTYLCAKYIM